jgi:hypothetical protein
MSNPTPRPPDLVIWNPAASSKAGLPTNGIGQEDLRRTMRPADLGDDLFVGELRVTWAPTRARLRSEVSPVTTRDALDEAMHRETVDGAMSALLERGVWMADVDTMTRAIHAVYCGIMADHEHPNEKDRDQARQLIAAIGQSIGTGAGATKD